MSKEHCNLTSKLDKPANKLDSTISNKTKPAYIYLPVAMWIGVDVTRFFSAPYRSQLATAYFAKHNKSHLYCNSSHWVALKQVRFSLVIPIGFKIMFVLSAGRCDPTETQNFTRSICLAILDVFLSLVCTPG